MSKSHPWWRLCTSCYFRPGPYGPIQSTLTLEAEEERWVEVWGRLRPAFLAVYLQLREDAYEKAGASHGVGASG